MANSTTQNQNENENNGNQESQLNRQKYEAGRQGTMAGKQEKNARNIAGFSAGQLPEQARQKGGQPPAYAKASAGGRLPESGQSKMASAQLGQEQNAARNAAQREAKNKQPEGGVSAPQAVNQVKESVSFLKSFAAFIEPTTAMVLTFWLFIEILGVKKFIKGGEEKPFSKLKLAEIIVLALADIMWLAIVTLIIVIIYKILNGDFGFWTVTKAILRGVGALVPGGQGPIDAFTTSIADDAVKSIVPE